MITLYIIIGLLLNFILAAIAFALIDNNNELYNWLWKQAPKTDNILESMAIWFIQLLIITLWPITVYIYLIRK